MSDTDKADFINLMLTYAQDRQAILKQRNGRVAHYTTAETAMLILQNKELWMRSASVMNDSNEVYHGLAIIETVFGDETPLRERFFDVLDAVGPDIVTGLRVGVHMFASEPIEHTFIASLSEYEDGDERGLLSMWRAYGGGSAAAALIFNVEALDGPAEFDTMSSPVFYGSHELFFIEFEKMVARLERSLPLMKRLEPIFVSQVIHFALQAMIVSLKHEGFKEEKEWRLIHRPYGSGGSAWVEADVTSIFGVPQVIYKLPLENKPGMQVPEYNMKQILHQVVVGPSLHPAAVRLGFVEQLIRIGFDTDDAYDRVKVTDIPLRRSY